MLVRNFAKRSLKALAAGLMLGTASVATAVPLQFTPIGLAPASVPSFDGGAAEIPAFDPQSNRLFVVNAQVGVDVFDISDPFNPAFVETFSAPGTNSVAVHNGTLALAVANANTQAAGTVQFFDAFGSFKGAVAAGALPDMVTFTPDGQKVLVANEGEPNDDYTIDPVGSVSIIDVSGGFAAASTTTAGFDAFNGMEDTLRDAGVRIFGPGASAAQDFEPEHIAVSDDSKTAYVALQENNALAVVDLDTNTVTDVLPLGFKDHALPGNGLDANKNDDAINIQNEPIFGMFQPDAIALYSLGGEDFIVTANEGDARDYDGFSEEADLKDVDLDPGSFSPGFIDRAGDTDDIGDLTITNTRGDTDGDGDFDEIFANGARSFSIFKRNETTGELELVFDSGDAFEQITAATLPDDFNSNNDENDSFESRSDNKGPEPEGVTLGQIGDQVLAFIGLERVGGVMVYDITDPNSPQFLDYLFETRDFSVDLDVDADNDDIPDNLAAAGDLGPEGLLFIDAADSPTGIPLLVVANEISGTTRIYSISEIPSPTAASLMSLVGLGLMMARRRRS